jgi:hypothetical protein
MKNVATLIDFSSQEVMQNTQSLPLVLAAGTETILTSIFLNIKSISNKLVLQATVGWQPELLLLPIVPKLTLRIRRGGFTPAFPEVYQTTDSEFLGTGSLTSNIITTTINHVESPDPFIVGTFQQYFLTVQSNGIGNITVVGPVTLLGTTIGF